MGGADARLPLVAVVTGASSGMGLEVSRLLASARHDLVIVAQHTERLTQVAREFTTQYGVRVMTDGVPNRAIASGAANGSEGRTPMLLEPVRLRRTITLCVSPKRTINGHRRPSQTEPSRSGV
jgi:NAD(P)-dependent dehydrogenase (short-subunit alcohol dehydrogenase family)